jgi:hypothetical protein
MQAAPAVDPVGGLGRVEDLLPVELDAANDRRPNGIARHLRGGHGGEGKERKSEGEAAGQKRLRELDRM